MKPIILFLLLSSLGFASGVYSAYRTQAAGLSNSDKSAEQMIEEKNKDTTETEFVKLNNQFVVPLLSNGEVASLVIVSLTLEIRSGQREQVFNSEPKLRDALLTTLFAHANLGTFSGRFTEVRKIEALRTSLEETANSIMNGNVHSVLITDLVRQDQR